MHEAVSCAIPGAKRPEQVADNCATSDLPRLSGKLMRQVQEIY
jgi:aryl-alcohol dehydrogenase-like predicted oxidoreductase